MRSRLIIILVLLTLLLSACQLSLAEDVTPPPNYQSPTVGPTMSPLFPQKPADLASGAVIYAEKCASCHGDKGLGDGPQSSGLQKQPAAIGSPEIGRQAAPANWYTSVTEGNVNSEMPAFKDSLSDQQRWDVVAYTISLGGATAAESLKGQVLYQTNCVKCHGPAGDAVDKVNFSDQSLMSKLTQADIAAFINRGNGTMPAFGGLIPDSDIYALASYVRSYSILSGATVVTNTNTPQAVDATPTATVASAGSDLTTTPAAVSTLDLTPTPAGTPQAIGTSQPTASPTTVIGIISGKVTNGSGSSIPASLTVTLHIYEHDATNQNFTEVGSQDTQIAGNGTYKFSDVQLLQTRAFFVSVNYLGTEFDSDPVFPTAGQTVFDLPVNIYETTTDASGLVVDKAHVLLDYSKQGMVEIWEFMIISNPGTKAIVPTEKNGPVVSISLPKNYTNLQFDQGSIGSRYLKTADGFADTLPVMPGSQKYQLIFGFDIPLPKAGMFGGQQIEIDQLITLKTAALSVLAPDGVTVVGQNFTAAGNQDMGNGTTYQVFNTTGLDKGSTLKFTASGTPKTVTTSTTTGTNSNQGIIIGVGVLGAALLLIGAWLYQRERSRSKEEEPDEEDSQEESEDIIDEIVALDDQYKSGKIPEAVYQERRAELKSKLKNNL